jgi:hypothetical protein
MKVSGTAGKAREASPGRTARMNVERSNFWVLLGSRSPRDEGWEDERNSSASRRFAIRARARGLRSIEIAHDGQFHDSLPDSTLW